MRQFPPQQVQQQGRDQRTMHHQTGIALGPGDISAVVMDAVAVEGQRGIAEQQHVVGDDPPRPLGILRRGCRCRRRFARLRQVAVDDVVFLVDREQAVAADLVPHLHEHQGTGAPFLHAHVVDPRGARQRLSGQQRRDELEAAARPHATRQRHRRQEATALRVAVRSDLGLAVHRQEIEPVPARRHGVTVQRRVVAVQRGAERAQRDERRRVLHGLGPTDPAAQVFDVQRHEIVSFEAILVTQELSVKYCYPLPAICRTHSPVIAWSFDNFGISLACARRAAC
jgi:hypothetical protein